MSEINQTFRVRYEFGQIFLTNAAGGLLGVDAVGAIAQALVQAHNYLLSTNQTQEDIYEAMMTSDEVIKRAKVEYPFDHKFALRGRNGNATRPQSAPRFHGVYVLTLEQHPDLVKIGLTTDLYQRSKELKYSTYPSTVDTPKFLPVAFLHTEELTTVESFLHRKFAPFRTQYGEWFLRAPVESWLQQYGSAS